MNCRSFERYRIVVAAVVIFAAAGAAQSNEFVKFSMESGATRILIGDAEFAQHYPLGDALVPRPFFTGLRTAKGIEVTRTHPPREGIDASKVLTADKLLNPAAAPVYDMIREIPEVADGTVRAVCVVPP